MVAIQSTAVELFVADGFANVTMQAIADAAGVGVATVYRYFGTKEDLVIWDEHEELVLDAIERNLARLPAVAAVRAALIEFAPIYETDANLALARLACNEPAIVSATSLSDRQAVGELAEACRQHDPSMSAVAASAVAACVPRGVGHRDRPVATRPRHQGARRHRRRRLRRYRDALAPGLTHEGVNRQPVAPADMIRRTRSASRWWRSTPV